MTIEVQDVLSINTVFPNLEMLRNNSELTAFMELYDLRPVDNYRAATTPAIR